MADGAGPWLAGWSAIQSGRPADAEQLCREALLVDPRSAEGWFLLGTACLCQGRPAEAADAYAQALQLQPDYPEAWINLGNALRGLGRFGEAEASFRRALALRPDFVEAHHNLGVALRELGRPVEAEACFRQALGLRPDAPENHYHLGHALREQGRLDEAADCYRRTVALRPDSFDALTNLGSALRSLGRPAEAVEYYTRALRLRPDSPDVHNNLGNALLDLGRRGEAESSYRRALTLRPDYPEAYNNLGNALLDQGRPAEAAECYRRALALRPDLPAAHYNLGNALRDFGRLGEAEGCYRQALGLSPDYAEALTNLGNLLQDMGRPGESLDCFRRATHLRPHWPDGLVNLGSALRELGRPSEAEERYRRALALRPDYPEALGSLAIALQDQTRLGEAAECYRRALELRPDLAAAHSALLLALHYKPGVTPAELAAAHAEYQHRHAAPLRAGWSPFANNRDPDRPLRLGLVSPDFGRHPVGFLLVRAVEALARRECAVVCYSERRATPDELTARFRAAASLWRDSARLSDERLAELVRADGIDVLIDLAGHTGGNRLLAFARRPAPVQATWLGYEGTTGLEAIDYLIADERLVPAGAEAHYRECVLRLPNGYAAYEPPAGAPEPGPPPVLALGHVTFGCFNNPAKLSPPALAAFADVLRRVPRSRLVLQYRGLDDPAVSGRLCEHFAAAGVARGRVELRGATRHAEYLAAYQGVDIALDPFPFAGGVTTCDSLWMGVPVVTQPGETFASRHGLSHLGGVRLTELVATDAEGYAALAATLAHDLDRLASLRTGLRDQVARSPLCDGARLGDELLTVLRCAWREWAIDSPTESSARGCG